VVFLPFLFCCTFYYSLISPTKGSIPPFVFFVHGMRAYLFVFDLVKAFIEHNSRTKVKNRGGVTNTITMGCSKR
jgi:hypothetical protein